MKEVNFFEYRKKLISANVPADEIYDFSSAHIKNVYQHYFDWCIDNLNDYGKTFEVEPSYFYYWDTHEINAQAGLVNGKYIIRFSKSYMEVLHKKFGRKGEFIGNTDWTSFHNLQKVLTDSLEYLMFQASTIFTFYHEFAHLVQMKGKAFEISEYSEYGSYSFQQHLFEYDADLNGCQFVSIYIQQFFREVVPIEHQTGNNFKRLMYLGISSIIITRLLFLNCELYPFKPNNINTEFYTKKGTHPHTYVRAKYIIEHYVGIAKANGVNIDFRDTTMNVSIICNEFFKDSQIFKEFIKGMAENFKAINIYSSELYRAQKIDKNCIKHKISLFGFL